MAMTIEQRLQVLEDIQAITELKANYCNSADGGWDRPSHDADKVASLFVEDGVWNAGEIGRGEGREAIRALFNGFKRFPFAFHRVSNPIIKVNGDTAMGEWHVLVPITFENNEDIWAGGIYNDQFVRTRDGWKFKSLKFTLAFMTKNEQGWKVGGNRVMERLNHNSAMNLRYIQTTERHGCGNPISLTRRCALGAKRLLPQRAVTELPVR